MLHQQKQATIYTSDIDRNSPLFPAVQWAGIQGLFSDLVEYKTAVLPPLKRRFGTQYSFAHALHAVEPEKPMDAALLARWRKALPCAAGVDATTRGGFLQAAFDRCANK
jgi:hypothetical protein